MSNVPKSSTANDATEQLADLSEEFPGWIVKMTDQPNAPYQAVRDGADASLTLCAGSVDALAALLDEADAIDCARALSALREALQTRGAVAVQHTVSVVTKTRTGIARVIGAHRGRFNWDSGLDLGPLTDVDAVAEKVVNLLDLKAER